jgi:branched-chain amino acid transport system ATP-binding protein
VVLVEQSLERALRIADRAYVLQRGRVVMTGTAKEINARRADVESVYLHESFASPDLSPELDSTKTLRGEADT